MLVTYIHFPGAWKERKKPQTTKTPKSTHFSAYIKTTWRCATRLNILCKKVAEISGNTHFILKIHSTWRRALLQLVLTSGHLKTIFTHYVFRLFSFQLTFGTSIRLEPEHRDLSTTHKVVTRFWTDPMLYFTKKKERTENISNPRFLVFFMTLSQERVMFEDLLQHVGRSHVDALPQLLNKYFLKVKLCI